MRRVTRREALISAAVAAVGLADGHPSDAAPDDDRVVNNDRVVKNGRLKQSASRWCYQPIPLPELCRASAAMGLTAIDLLEEPDWSVVRRYGLTCSMGGRRHHPERVER